MNAHDHIRADDAQRRVLPAGETAGPRGTGPGPVEVALTLAATPDAPALARQAARDAFAHWDPARKDAALLVISELVTNAVRHGSDSSDDRVALHVRRRDAATRIEVTDANAAGTSLSAKTPPLRGDARTGWGLPIVAELTDRWGVEQAGTRTRVWCELDLH